MDATTESEIRTTYRDEYFKKTEGDVRGPAGWLLRKMSAFENKVKQWETEKSWKMPAAMLSASVLPAYAFIGAFMLSPVLGMGLIVASGVAAAYTLVEMTRTCDAAMKRDIDNGTLAERYKAEVLTPKLQQLEQQLASLPARGAATAEFTAVADAAKPDAQQKPAPLVITLPPPGM